MFFRNVKNKILHFEVQNWKGVFWNLFFWHLSNRNINLLAGQWPTSRRNVWSFDLMEPSHTHTHTEKGGERERWSHILTSVQSN